MSQPEVAVIGGGLAGCECAFQIARFGIPVTLFEMRPETQSEAHQSGELAELVCSNSFRARGLANAVGLIKEEMRRLGGMIMSVADKVDVPAGGAHAVDREAFARGVTELVEAHEGIRVMRKRIDSLDDPELSAFAVVILSTGPLTGGGLAEDIARRTGKDRLYFYDAIAPVVDADSVNRERVFTASRYGKGGDDYINCPMDKELYNHFIDELLAAEKIALNEADEARFFPGCQPIEEIARLGRMSPAFGPMKPVGLRDPATGRRPFAVVQLRLENRKGTAFNLVGFQTRLKYPEQKRVFQMIPGLEEASFLRLGSVHRNTYVDTPRVLDSRLRLRNDARIRFAGQITGVEGYVESTACGLLQGLFTAAEILGLELPVPPEETALGAMLAHLLNDLNPDFQPSNIHWGHFPPMTHDSEGKKLPGGRKGRPARREAMSGRALEALSELDLWLTNQLGN